MSLPLLRRPLPLSWRPLLSSALRSFPFCRKPDEGVLAASSAEHFGRLVLAAAGVRSHSFFLPRGLPCFLPPWAGGAGPAAVSRVGAGWWGRKLRGTLGGRFLPKLAFPLGKFWSLGGLARSDTWAAYTWVLLGWQSEERHAEPCRAFGTKVRFIRGWPHRRLALGVEQGHRDWYLLGRGLCAGPGRMRLPRAARFRAAEGLPLTGQAGPVGRGCPPAPTLCLPRAGPFLVWLRPCRAGVQEGPCAGGPVAPSAPVLQWPAAHGSQLCGDACGLFAPLRGAGVLCFLEGSERQ